MKLGVLVTTPGFIDKRYDLDYKGYKVILISGIQRPHKIEESSSLIITWKYGTKFTDDVTDVKSHVVCWL